MSNQPEQPRHRRLHAFVYGRVQGVNFRAYSVRKANHLGLTGWILNRRDGSVEAVAEGPEGALDEFEQFLHKGSPHASVERVEVSREKATGEFDGFTVNYRHF